MNGPSKFYVRRSSDGLILSIHDTLTEARSARDERALTTAQPAYVSSTGDWVAHR